MLIGVGSGSILVLSLAVSLFRWLRTPVVVLGVRFEPQQVERNQPVVARVSIRPSCSWRRFDLILNLRTDTRPSVIPVVWNPTDPTGGQFLLPGPDRGVYRCEDIRIAVPDPFFTSWFYPALQVDPGALHMIPRIRPMKAALIVRGSGGREPDWGVSHRRDGSHLDVRPYIPGDDINRLNWNLYAHTGDLFVRIPEELPPPLRTLLLLIDPDQPDAPTMDAVIESGLGLAEYLETRGYRVVLAADTMRVGDYRRARSFLTGFSHQPGKSPVPGDVRKVGSSVLRITSGRSGSCPEAVAGDWIVVIPLEGAAYGARRIAALT